MRNGMEVRYIDADDASHSATVVDIVGAGTSGAKRLDLSFTSGGEDMTAEDVPYQDDAEEGQGFWLLRGERRTRHVADDDAEPTPPDTAAFPDRAPDAAPAAPPLAPRRRRAAST